MSLRLVTGEPDKDMIGMLRHLLGLAEKGEVTAVMMLAFRRGGTHDWALMGDHDGPRTLFALDRLRHKLHQQLDEAGNG